MAVILASFVFTNASAQSSPSFIDYSDYFSYSTTVVQSLNTNSVCDGYRKDIYELFPEERAELAGLIIDYLTSEEWSGYDPNHPDVTLRHPSLKYDVVAAHSAYGDPSVSITWHSDTELFLSWHRDYIRGLEGYLLEQGYHDYVPLPSWNPNTSVPDEFLAGSAMVSEVYNTPYQYAAGGTQFGMPINQIPANTYGMYQVDDMTCSQFSDIDAFAGYIRANNDDYASHNTVHGALGGAMVHSQTASAAAIFWLFHAYVDELYYCYQDLCEGCDHISVAEEAQQSECTACLDFSGTGDFSNLNVINVEDQLGNTVSLPFDANGCIDETWRLNNLEGGDIFTLLVSAENECSFDAKQISLFIPAYYTDPALGYRILCDYDIEVWPNPVGGFSPVEIEIQSDSGTGKTLEIRHVDLAKNTTTVLWSPGTLAGGQTVQLTVSTSGWSTGNHAIQFFLDGELYTRVISKF
jgi:hypothetical protein